MGTIVHVGTLKFNHQGNSYSIQLTFTRLFWLLKDLQFRQSTVGYLRGCFKLQTGSVHHPAGNIKVNI